jgi:hypothetical protein
VSVDSLTVSLPVPFIAATGRSAPNTHRPAVHRGEVARQRCHPKLRDTQTNVVLESPDRAQRLMPDQLQPDPLALYLGGLRVVQFNSIQLNQTRVSTIVLTASDVKDTKHELLEV